MCCIMELITRVVDGLCRIDGPSNRVYGILFTTNYSRPLRLSDGDVSNVDSE